MICQLGTQIWKAGRWQPYLGPEGTCFWLLLPTGTCSSTYENGFPCIPWLQNMPPLTFGVFFLAVYTSFHLATAVADQCSGGNNIFTEIPENSPHGTLVSYLTIPADPMSDIIQLSLSGIDAEWFYLDGKAVRLNVSEERVLDREALETPVLMVSFTCTEDGFSPVEYRIIVQVMNENDNKPQFQEDSVGTRNISEGCCCWKGHGKREGSRASRLPLNDKSLCLHLNALCMRSTVPSKLAALHSVVFSTQAEDADGDTLMYVIDSSSVDARYFRIDLPNSGKIVLAKALDFETKRHLEFVVHAVEMNTKERYNSSARIQVNVMDGDDQYPQFLPCNFLSRDGVSVCVSPVYTTNITEGEVKTGPLHFLPGAIHAEDGDLDLKAAITYSILSGTDHGYFHMDNMTGAISMLQPVESRARTPVYSLSVMASQVNDAKKYAVTEVRVRVLAVNSHPLHFGKPQYQAFVHEDDSMAALVVTYSGRVLALSAADLDFADGFNPMVHYSLKRQSNHTQLFQITPGGLLIARANHLHALQRYALQIIARDEESGDAADTTVNVEVLRAGQAVPIDPLEAGHQGTLDAGILAGSLGALLFVTAIVLFIILRAMKKRQQHQQNMERAALAMEKHPNVVNAGKALPGPGNIYFQNEGYSDLGDEMPKLCGGQTLNSKPVSVRSENALAVKETPVANSVGKAVSHQGAPAKAGPAPKEQEEGAARAALLNGKTLAQLSCSTPRPEEKASSSADSSSQPLAGGTRLEGQVVEEEEEEVEVEEVEVELEVEEEVEVAVAPAALGAQASMEEKQVGDASRRSEEEALLEARPQQEEKSCQDDKMEVDGNTSKIEPAPEGPATTSNCVDVEVGDNCTSPQTIHENVNPSHVISETETAMGTVEVSDLLSAPKQEPTTPPLMLKEVSKESSEEEDEGEETPKAVSPTYQDPLASLPISDVRMPVTLLQLLEDSIEC
ncbi:uncharacterized protein LOC128328499 isoform X2 [Hemicordylus capensis]|uniref:uncharacterized protein LOC128328499 isoform X2 n=1 Tax=Hemicordylus capensis TaxID=884348 RepID=UPI00230318CC|nr:uncharacterized protein LOC128328499 isoform X2 [Hemicordylus capensis]